MPKEVKDLQALINERAERLLDKDILEVQAFVINDPILKDGYNLPKIQMSGDKPGEAQCPMWFLQNTSEYMKAVKAVMLPTYIQEETKMFMKKVDSLQGQINELLHHQQQEEDLPY